MTRNGRLSMIVFAIIALSACAKLPAKVAGAAAPAANPNAEASVPDMHSSQTALDWAGTYVGTLPCADCPGVRETLVLRHDQTYDLSMHYLDRPDSDFSRNNRFIWINGQTIRLEGMQQPMYFRVEENQLIQLAMDGQPITGPLAAKMVLKKK